VERRQRYYSRTDPRRPTIFPRWFRRATPCWNNRHERS